MQGLVSQIIFRLKIHVEFPVGKCCMHLAFNLNLFTCFFMDLFIVERNGVGGIAVHTVKRQQSSIDRCIRGEDIFHSRFISLYDIDSEIAVNTVILIRAYDMIIDILMYLFHSGNDLFPALIVKQHSEMIRVISVIPFTLRKVFLQDPGNVLQEKVSFFKTKEFVHKLKSAHVHQYHGIIRRLPEQSREICDKAVPVVSACQNILICKDIEGLMFSLQQIIYIEKQNAEHEKDTDHHT